jgi:hypothetical protein
MPHVIRHPGGKIQFYLLRHSNQLTTPEHDVALGGELGTGFMGRSVRDDCSDLVIGDQVVQAIRAQHVTVSTMNRQRRLGGKDLDFGVRP